MCGDTPGGEKGSGMSSELFKILRCKCGKQEYHEKEMKKPPPCSRCGEEMSYSKKWFIKTWENGKRKIQAVSGGRRHTADALEKQKYDIVNRKFGMGGVAPESPLLSVAIEETYQDRWRKAKTGDRSRRFGLKIMEMIGDKPLSEINGNDMRTIETKLACGPGKGAPSSVNRHKSVLRLMLRRHDVRYKYLNFEVEENSRIRVLSQDEETKLLSILNTTSPNKASEKSRVEMRDLVPYLLDTGARMGEALRLETRDVNMDTGMITIWKNKANHPRSIPMTPRVKDIVKRRMECYITRLFQINITRADRSMLKARIEMGLEEDEDFVLHAMRHTCCTRLMVAGIAPQMVQLWMGHKSILMTMRYSHLAPEHLWGAMNVLANHTTVNETSTVSVTN